MTDLSRLTAAEIDALPFGFIGLDREGQIRKYNRYEADLARTDPTRVLGRNFFKEVAPCTQVQEFEGRFRDFASGRIAEPTLAFDFEFRFRHGAQKVRIGLVRSPLEDEIIVTVNRVHDLKLAATPGVTPDLERRLLADGADERVLALGADFLRAMDVALGGRGSSLREQTLQRMGVEWGQRHALRLEAMIQRDHQRAMREVELHVALEYVTGSLALIGLGRAEVDLAWRRRGLLVVTHTDSPQAIAGEAGERCCALLAGFHAGVLGHLSGRPLAGLELQCGTVPPAPCRFAIGTEARLERLLDPVAGSADADLLVALGVRPRVEVGA
ncbi:MAG: PAS domain-containing protein [Vicinamibacteria bacterium]|nr:PAS domain-containing protein [Vicinamibacteria bacterium]